MELVDFLMQAKRATYASGAQARDENHAKVLEYQQDDFLYVDRYFGFDPFIGEEMVWRGGAPLWAMNYAGKVVSAAAPAGEVYAFLQRAMQKVERSRPFRGPDTYTEGEWEYRDASRGGLEFYCGTERILFRGEEVYRLEYHGGQLG